MPEQISKESIMTNEEVLEIFKKAGAFLEGHFILTSGKHSPNYFEKAKVLQYPENNTIFAREIIDHFKDKKIDLVIAPATAAIVLGTETARQLNVRSVYSERENGIMSLRRGFEIQPGENVLIVEDIVTTGGSVFEVIELVKKLGGNVTGIGLLIDRSNGKVNFGYDTKALATVEAVSYDENEIPEWLSKIPAVKPGSRSLKN
jgi:orotate phosphoribosyltransferase